MSLEHVLFVYGAKLGTVFFSGEKIGFVEMQCFIDLILFANKNSIDTFRASLLSAQYNIIKNKGKKVYLYIKKIVILKL